MSLLFLTLREERAALGARTEPLADRGVLQHDEQDGVLVL